MKQGLLVTALLMTAEVPAQWDLPMPMELIGENPADRQILGLADPLAPDAAVSLDALRAQTMSFATAFGNTVLATTLTPAPSSYTMGMTITVVPNESNLAGAQIDVNGLGPVAIVKWGGVPLDSADMPAGSPARLVYDGAHFQLLTSAYRPCPPGFSAVNRQFCIADSIRPAYRDFFQASLECSSTGARLCSMAEWITACRQFQGFIGTVVTMEWVDHASNNARDAKVLGAGWFGTNPVEGTDCRYGRSRVPETVLPFRCCISR
jgi:hypothetical protein